MKIDIKELLIKNYPQLRFNQIKVEEFKQGYMNYTVRIEIIKGNDKNLYTGVFYNINRYHDQYAFNFLTEIYEFSKFLYDNKLPTRTAVSNKKGELLTWINEKRLFGLYNYLEGETIPWESYTRRHLHALGQRLVEFHKLGMSYLQKRQIKYIPSWREYVKVDYKKMRAYFIENSETIGMKLNFAIDFDKLNKVYQKISIDKRAMDSSTEVIDKQGNEELVIKDVDEENSRMRTILHMDFVRSNILFSDKKQGEYYPITGILDFEKVLVGSVLPDLGRTLAFLFVDCKYKSYDRVLYEFLKKGYCQSVKVKFREIYVYMLYFLVRDMWKFLQSNPYESLSKNEHYNRTKSLLLNYKIIKNYEA